MNPASYLHFIRCQWAPRLDEDIKSKTTANDVNAAPGFLFISAIHHEWADKKGYDWRCQNLAKGQDCLATWRLTRGSWYMARAITLSQKCNI